MIRLEGLLALLLLAVSIFWPDWPWVFLLWIPAWVMAFRYARWLKCR